MLAFLPSLFMPAKHCNGAVELTRADSQKAMLFSLLKWLPAGDLA